jgi:WD40 repeat protein
MNKSISLLLILVFVCGIGSVSLPAASAAQEKTTSVAGPAQNKLPVRLKAKLPDYKGPSRFMGRRALITFSPDGRLVAMSGTKRTITVWDTTTGQLKTTLKGSKEGISGFAFSPDGRIAATKDYLDKSLRIWDVANWELKATVTGRKRNLETKLKAGVSYEEEFGPVPFSPDGRTVLSEKEDDLVVVSEVPDGKELTKLNHDSRGGGSMEVLRILFLAGSSHFLFLQTAFNSDGKLAFTINGDKFAKIWEVATGKQKAVISNKERIYRAAFTPDGTRLLTVEQQGGMKLWDVETGTLVGEIAKKGYLENLMKNFEFSPDGKLIATFYLGDTRLWDARTAELKFKLLDSETTDGTFSSDGRWLATASREKRYAARIWNVETGEVKLTLPPTTDKSVFVKFSPDGSLLVTTNDKGVAVWDAATGELLATLSEARYPVAFSPDGRTLTTGARNDTALLWEIPVRE